MSRLRGRDRLLSIHPAAAGSARPGAAGGRFPASGETTRPGTGPAGLSHRTVTNDPAGGELRQPDVTENVTAADPLAELQALVAEYESATARARNYGSSRFADLFYWAAKELLPSVEPLSAERAAQIEDMLRRADYGPGPARALAGSRPRHLRAVD